MTTKNKHKHVHSYTLNCKGKLILLDKPCVMGIMNVTPDSFVADSRAMNVEEALHKAEKMITAGATFIDIGGQSTRPGSTLIPVEEELRRITPIIEAIAKTFPDIFISIDTFYATVAATAINAGAHIVNDISAGKMDAAMLATVANLQVPYIAMHSKGTPQTMQQHCVYEDVVREVLDYSIERIDACRKAGIKDVIIDPGFGFSKNSTQNFQLLKNLSIFSMLKCPLLVGLSRKSMIHQTLNIKPEDALNGTTVLQTLALTQGAHIVRTHDVKEAMEMIVLWENYISKP
ncbi:MAG TPA: dihydropteroate synthase [Chitinophagaceae bacterium]|nr:dihydropteroate synthase [Chitinophagaceae bacterium]